MPYWDAARLRLVLTEAELNGAPVEATSALPDLAAEMLATVAAPARRVLVQLYTSASPPLTHRIWSTRRAAVVGATTGHGLAELSAAEPALIPYLVAHLVGLRRRRPPQGRKPIRVPLPAYRAAEAGAADVPELAAVIRSRQSSWRVTAGPPDGRAHSASAVRSLHVTDAGPAGLWRVTKDKVQVVSGVGARTSITLTPLRPGDVWSILTREVLS